MCTKPSLVHVPTESFFIVYILSARGPNAPPGNQYAHCKLQMEDHIHSRFPAHKLAKMYNLLVSKQRHTEQCTFSGPVQHTGEAQRRSCERFARYARYRLSDFQIFRFSDFQIFRFSDFQIFRFSDFQIFRFSDFQIFRFSDLQIDR